MKYLFWALSFIGVLIGDASAQNIQLTNPSFEDTPAEGTPPSGWLDCGFENESAPDVHPDFIYRVTKEPYHGNSYLGMVTRDNETWERVSQRLSAPLEAGKCYEFSIYLARSAVYISKSAKARNTEHRDVDVNYTTPIKLRIWGGVGPCARTQLLAESNIIKNTRWLRFDFRFNPDYTLSYITLEAFYNTPVLFPYNGNILLDNASAIVEVPCEEEIPVIAELPTPPPPPSNEEVLLPKDGNQQQPKPKQTGAFSSLKAEDLRPGITLPIDKLYFMADSSNFTPESVPALEDIYLFLKENPKVIIEIGGHTNGIPPHDYCDRLSTARARAVANYLITKGIEARRVKYKGYGKRKPIATNKTPEGRKKNQRVEITILSTGSQ